MTGNGPLDVNPVIAPNANETGRDQHPNLHVINLRYDHTPPEFITMVVSEVGMIPVTSVLVIVKEYRKDVAEAED